MNLYQLNIKGQHFDVLDHEGSMTTYWLEREFNEDSYQLDTMDINPEDTVIDVGANIGLFSLYVNRKFGCKVIAFEPVKEIYENAKANLQLNGIESGIGLHNFAVTDKDGDTIQIGFDTRNTGGSSAFKSTTTVECRTTTLNRFIETCKNPKLLKIDCEGGEYQIIPSILEHLNKFKYIAIEYHKYNETQNPLELHQMILDNFDGKLICNDPSNPVTW